MEGRKHISPPRIDVALMDGGQMGERAQIGCFNAGANQNATDAQMGSTKSI